MSQSTFDPSPPEPVLTPDPRPSERRFPEGFTLAAAAVLGAVIVLAGLLLWQQRSRDDELAADGSTTVVVTEAPGPATTPTSMLPSTSSTPTTAPSTTGTLATVETVACPTGTDPVICDAAEYVQQVRQRPFTTFPTVELLPDTEFDQALLTDFEQYREELDADGVTLTALGLLDPGTSLADAYRDALEIGVVGFYDPETERLVVREAGSEGFNLYAQLVLVHELVHAFDDQWFDLNREDFVDDEAEYGFTAVAEGNAKRVDEQWRAGLDSASQVELAEQEMGALSPEDVLRYFSLPPILQHLQLSPYTDGGDYVRQRLGEGGEAAVDQDLTEPPLTSEAILHPGSAGTGPAEVDVAPPAAGGDVVEEGRLGELIVTQWLGSTAGQGWGGDQYVAWRDGARSCIAVDLAADTAGDLGEIEQAAGAWAGEDSANRTATSETVGGVALVRVTACAG
jgi:hypothetical protein